MAERKTNWAVPATWIAVLGASGATFGSTLPFTEQWPVYDGLRQTASIVFGVSGAILAIAYPSALQVLVRRRGPVNPNERDAFYDLLTPMWLSFVVLASVLLAGFSAPVIRHWSWAVHHATWVRRGSFAGAGALTAAQMYAVARLVVPILSMLSDVELADRRRSMANRYDPPATEDDADEDGSAG